MSVAPRKTQEIAQGAADAIWAFVRGKGPTPTAAREVAYELIEAYEEAWGGRSVAGDDIASHWPELDAWPHRLSAKETGAELVYRALIEREPRGTWRRYGHVKMTVALQGDELVWEIAECNEGGGAAKVNPCTCSNPSDLRFEVMDTSTRRIVGHVTAKTAWDAQDLAVAQFGPNVMVYAETPGKPTPVGAELWSGRANPAGEHVHGFTAKGNRMYEHVLESHRGDPRAKEIAARTVYAKARAGTPGLVKNPSGDQWLVLRVGGKALDTYAVPYERRVPEAIEAAKELAQPKRGDLLEYAIVSAPDAGAARLAKPSRWSKVAKFNPEHGACACETCMTAAEIAAE